MKTTVLVKYVTYLRGTEAAAPMVNVLARYSTLSDRHPPVCNVPRVENLRRVLYVMIRTPYKRQCRICPIRVGLDDTGFCHVSVHFCSNIREKNHVS